MPSLKRLIKDWAKRSFFAFYKLGTRLGVHVLPVHYYCSEPDIVDLKKSVGTWANASSLPGIHVGLDEQLATLRDICLPYQAEYCGNKVYNEAVRMGAGPGFGYIEAQALHAVIRHFKPRRIVEVGSGVSSFCAHAAMTRNQQETGGEPNLVCIEPFPSGPLQRLSTTAKNVRILAEPVQTVPFEVFSSLGENDILFIDSSHAVKAGSDVNHLVLEVLPRLGAGSLVHFHDIYFPYDYQRDLLDTFIHANETSLVRAFLIYNERFRILFCLSHLHYERSTGLAAVFPEYCPQDNCYGMQPANAKGTHFPSSLWLRVN